MGFVSNARLALRLAEDLPFPAGWRMVGSTVEWAENGLLRHLVVASLKHDPTRVNWWTEVRVAGLDEQLVRTGGLYLLPECPMVDDAVGWGGYPRPQRLSGIDQSLLDHVGTYAMGGLNFVRDVRDFGEILLGEGDLVRGDHVVKRDLKGSAGRLVKALMIARFTEDHDLERRALDKLAQKGDEPSVPKGSVEMRFRDWVAEGADWWASEVSVPLGDLIPVKQKGRRHSRQSKDGL